MRCVCIAKIKRGEEVYKLTASILRFKVRCRFTRGGGASQLQHGRHRYCVTIARIKNGLVSPRQGLIWRDSLPSDTRKDGCIIKDQFSVGFDLHPNVIRVDQLVFDRDGHRVTV